MSISLIVADDHPLVIGGIRNLLQKPEFVILGDCGDGNEALDAVIAHQPDLLILDIRMPGLDGLQVLRRLKGARLRTRTVVLTAALGDREVIEAIRLGTWGVVLKETAPRNLIECLRAVASGRKWLPPDMVEQALDDSASDPAAPIAQLTDRERDIVRLIAAGRRNKQIAEAFSITEGTVKIHLHNIYGKLRIGSRTELAVYAKDNGLG